MKENSQPDDVNDKKSWIDYGDQCEFDFVKMMNKAGFVAEINPEKTMNVYAPDLIVNGRVAELKTRRSPFFMSQKKYGIDPNYAVTINTRDVDRYASENPGMMIFFWTTYNKETRYGVEIAGIDGVWAIRMDKLYRLTRDAPVHKYVSRDGSGGNKTESYVVDLNDMEQLV